MRAGRRPGLTLALGLALGACHSEEPGRAEADAGGVPTPRALSCTVLLPAEVRDALLPSCTVEQTWPCPGCGPVCTLHAPSRPDVTVSFAYDCQPSYSQPGVDRLLAPSLERGGVEVPALGRAAARRAPVPGMVQVLAWDDDTPCLLVVTWLGPEAERAEEAARAALQALTPERFSTRTALPPAPLPAAPEASSPDAGTP